MSLSFPRIKTDSFITPLRIYHNEVMKTFTPFPRGRLTLKLKNLIKRIVVIALMPLLYPLTAVSAGVGYSLKGLIVLHLLDIASRRIRRGEFKQARELVAGSHVAIRNRVESRIFNKCFKPPFPQTHPKKALKHATIAAENIQDSNTKRDLMYCEIIGNHLLRQEFDKAFVIASKMTDADMFFVIVAEFVNHNQYLKATKLLSAFEKQLDPNDETPAITAGIAHQNTSIFAHLVNAASDDLMLKEAIECILIMNEGEDRDRMLRTLTENLCNHNLFNDALTLVNGLSDKKKIKADCVKLILDRTTLRRDLLQRHLMDLQQADRLNQHLDALGQRLDVLEQKFANTQQAV